MNFLEDQWNRFQVLTSHAARVTQALLRRFRDDCRAHGTELLVAGINRDGRTANMLAWAAREGFRTVDVSVDASIPTNVIPRDLHPSPAAHAVYAERVDAALATLLAASARGASRPR